MNPSNLKPNGDDQFSDSEQKENNSLLFNAVRKKNVSHDEKITIIKDLLNKNPKPDINAQDGNDEGNTPLHMAIKRRAINVVELLLQNGANINLKRNDGETPLTLARHLDRREIVKVLQSHNSISHIGQAGCKDNRQLVLPPQRPAVTSQQIGWNCFDVAVDLAKRLGIEAGEPSKQAQYARAELVKQALKHSSDRNYRALLASEIRHAVALTAAAMNTGHEVSTFGGFLPTSMRKSKSLFDKYETAHKGSRMKAVVDKCNDELQFLQFPRQSVDQLKEFFQDARIKSAHPNIVAEFNQTYQDFVQPHDVAFTEYCLQESTYRQYINDYYGNNEWFAFQAQFNGERSTCMVDVTAKILGIQIIIYDLKQAKITYQTESYGPDKVLVDYNGFNHFQARPKSSGLCEQPHKTVQLVPRSKQSAPTNKSKPLVQGWLHSDPVSASKSHDVPSGVKRQHVSSGVPTVPDKKLKTLFPNEEIYYFSLVGLKNSLHGNIYQLKLLMLFLKCGIECGYEFRLGTEVDNYEKFDDLVFKYLADGQEVFFSLQAKHKQDEKIPITSKSLLSAGSKTKNEYTLEKYFISFQKLKRNPDITGDIKDLIICTNIAFDTAELKKNRIDLEPVTEKDTFLDKVFEGKSASRYRLKIDNKHHNLYKSLKETSIAHQLAKSIVDYIDKDKTFDLKAGIFQSYHVALAKEIIDVGKSEIIDVGKSEIIDVGKSEKREPMFSIAFVQGSELSPSAQMFRRIFLAAALKSKVILVSGSEQDLWREISKVKLKLSKTFGKSTLGKEDDYLPLPMDEVTDDDIDEFFDKLLFAVGQPNEVELSYVIKHKLGEDSQFNLLRADLVLDSFQSVMLDWFKEKRGKWISTNDGLRFLKEIEDKVNTLITSGLGIAYPQKLKELDVTFTSSTLNELNKFFSDDRRQILHLRTPSDTLFNAIKVAQALDKSDHYKQDDSYLFLRSTTLLRPDIRKRIISAFKSPGSHRLLVIHCVCTTTDTSPLYEELSEIIKSDSHKKIILIGLENDTLAAQFETQHTSSFTMNADGTHVSDLTPESLQKLLEMKVAFQDVDVPLNMLLDESQTELLKSVPLTALIDKSRLNVGNKLPISDGYCTDYYIERTFNYQKDKVRRTYPPEKLMQFLHQAQQQKVVLISDTAGMGKTTVLTHLSLRIKEEDPTRWVARINLNDHVEELDKLQEKVDTELISLDEQEVIEFVSKGMLHLETDLDKLLFKQCFEKAPRTKLVMMFDGFDEISPNFSNVFLDILQVLQQSSVEQVWITTRPQLQGAFHFLDCYTLQPFSQANQEEFVCKFWCKKLKLESKYNKRVVIYAKALIMKLARSIYDRHFAGIPLQTRMLAEAFERKFIKFYHSKESTPDLPDKINLIDLYTKFIKGKYKMFLNKGEIAQDQQTDTMLNDVSIKKNHQILALQVLFPTRTDLHLILQDIKRLSPEEESRIGIVQYVNNKPRFTHRTFAEYFAADFLVDLVTSKQIQHARQAQDFLLEEVLLKVDYEVIRAFANGLLIKSTQPTLTFQENVKWIEGLPEKVCQRDFLGDTILHKAGEEGNTRIVGFIYGCFPDDSTAIDTLKYLLLAKNKSGQMAWHQAAMRGHIEVLEKLWEWGKCVGIILKDELLLAKGVNRQTAWDQAAMWGHTEVLEKLWKWGVEENFSTDELKNKLFLSEIGNKKNAWLLASGWGHVSVLEKLKMWAYDIGLNLTDLLLSKERNGQTAWHIASTNGHVEVLEILRTWTMETELSFKDSMLLAKDNSKESAWILAAQEGKVEVLEKLWMWSVEEGFNKNELRDQLLRDTDSDGQAIWHWAVELGEVEMFEKLWEWVLETGLNLKDDLLAGKDNYGQTLFHKAVIPKCFIEMLPKLVAYIEEQSTITPQDLKTIMLEKDDSEEVAWLRIVRYGDVKLLDKIRELTKTEHIHSENNESERLLVITDGDRRTAWHMVVKSDSGENLEYLLNWGEDEKEDLRKLLFFQEDNFGQTAWQIAAENGRIEILEKLWEFAKKNQMSVEDLGQLLVQKDSSGNTVWHLAVIKSDSWVLEKLWQWGTDAQLNKQDFKDMLLAVRDGNDQTILHRAVVLGHVKFLKKVHEFAIEVQLSSDEFKNKLLLVKDSDGMSVLHLAVARCNIKVLKYVIELIKNVQLSQQEAKHLLLQKNSAGRTILHLVVAERHLATDQVEVLDIVGQCINESGMSYQDFKMLLVAKEARGRNVLRLAVGRSYFKVLEKVCEFAKEAQLSPEQFRSELLLCKDSTSVNVLESLKNNTDIREPRKSFIINFLETYSLESNADTIVSSVGDLTILD